MCAHGMAGPWWRWGGGSGAVLALRQHAKNVNEARHLRFKSAVSMRRVGSATGGMEARCSRPAGLHSVQGC